MRFYVAVIIENSGLSSTISTHPINNEFNTTPRLGRPVSAAYRAAILVFADGYELRRSLKNRTIVYVDGFNLFYGALRGTSEAWLDLERLFRLLLPHDDLRRVRFFTALLMGPERVAQRTHLRALETTPLVEVTLGRFKTRRVRCRVAGCSMSGPRRFAWPEEKRTDVTIGISMLDDAYRNECDRLILVSGDSDLVPAISLIRGRFPEKEIVVYVPSRHPDRGAAVELRGVAHRARLLPLQVLKHAQFSDVVIDSRGRRIRKPADWNSRA